MSDEFIDEINAIRRKMMAECGNDIKKLGDLIKRSQKEDPENLVADVPPKQPEAVARGER